ncbi:Qat anti-phage system associated protein QatB [Noviherbaspirillum malthae]|uniref:Qat anti-phage system associated protein QatB n=1 Tax=Noviherbaspirillum malthae TaxID=1260987 RepID=UPI0018901D0F|nr:Qat anti-phage system associated protein QatB [Noviherbaspirillum malthae]
MGTSTSSMGPNSGVSLDPPWIDEVIGDIGAGSSVPPSDGEAIESPPGASGTAPSARYGDARRELGKYVRNGDTQHLGKALGHYSRRGSGGAGAAASRMRASTRAGAELFSFLNAISQRSSADAARWVDELRATNPSADDVVDAIVRELAPPGGSADEESLRDAMALALSGLVRDDPTVDPLDMRVDDIWELMKGYLATEVANRVCFDLGPVFESAQIDATTAVMRERQMRLFIKNELGMHVDLLRGRNANPTRAQLDSILQETLTMTFELFEAQI